MTMSDTEKLSKLESEISFIKRWWPVLAFVFALLDFAVRATLFINKNVATKADITIISKQIDSLSVAIISLKNDKSITKTTDTIYRLTVNNRIDNLDKEVKYIERQHGYVIEHTNTPGADPTIKHIQ